MRNPELQAAPAGGADTGMKACARPTVISAAPAPALSPAVDALREAECAAI